MAVKPIQLRVLAQSKEEENFEFRQFLKLHCRLTSNELDLRVKELTERIWAGIDCMTCGNCCKTLRPSFNEEEVARLAKRLGIERQKLIDEHLEPGEAGADSPWRTRTAPCPFLKDNRCSVYEDRPADCRGYPYLDKPDFTSRIWAMIDRTETCPIVYELMEALKRSVGFRYRRRKS